MPEQFGQYGVAGLVLVAASFIWTRLLRNGTLLRIRDEDCERRLAEAIARIDALSEALANLRVDKAHLEGRLAHLEQVVASSEHLNKEKPS